MEIDSNRVASEGQKWKSVKLLAKQYKLVVVVNNNVLKY